MPTVRDRFIMYKVKRNSDTTGVVKVFLVVLTITLAVGISVGFILRPPTSTSAALSPKTPEAQAWLSLCDNAASHADLLVSLVGETPSLSGGVSSCRVQAGNADARWVEWELGDRFASQDLAPTQISPFSLSGSARDRDGLLFTLRYASTFPQPTAQEQEVFSLLLGSLSADGAAARCRVLPSPEFSLVAATEFRGCVWRDVGDGSTVTVHGPFPHRVLLPSSGTGCVTLTKTNMAFRVCSEQPELHGGFVSTQFG